MSNQSGTTSESPQPNLSIMDTNPYQLPVLLQCDMGTDSLNKPMNKTNEGEYQINDPNCSQLYLDGKLNR